MSYFSEVTATLEDKYGFVVENTPMDEQRVAQMIRLVGATIVYE